MDNRVCPVEWADKVDTVDKARTLVRPVEPSLTLLTEVGVPVQPVEWVVYSVCSTVCPPVSSSSYA